MNGDIINTAKNLAANNEKIIKTARKAVNTYVDHIAAHFNAEDMVEKLTAAIAKEEVRFKANHDWILAYADEGCIYDQSSMSSEHLKEAAICIVKKTEFEKALTNICNNF